MKYGTWSIGSYREDAVLALTSSGFSPLTARVLSSRGLDTPEAANRMLSCHAPLHDPMLLREMDRAVCRIRAALDAGERICVYGDYDVDGVTATCLLTDCLRRLGADCRCYIPARLEEGYGLSESAIQQLHTDGVQLIVTVDCGITATQEALFCRQLGMDLIITDHHECKAELPQVCALIDPHRRDRTYPHTDLSGVGIAFKLAAALLGDQTEALQRYSDLVCLGTVADVMPLRGENRALVAAGLLAMQHPNRVGLAALIQECGCDKQPITASTVGYVLAPRINAAGRMGQVELATELFLTQDPARAACLAQTLFHLNRQRQAIEAEIYDDAIAMLPPGQIPPAIVLVSEDWHQGVVGIVASRLAEEFSRPTFLICMDGDRGKGSSRSYGGFNLFRALTQVSHLLEGYGGHELAAGFHIARPQIPAFRDALCRLATDYAADAPAASLQVDCTVPPALLTRENVAALEELEPCGAACPKPVMAIEHLFVEQLSEIGCGRHLRLHLRWGDGAGDCFSAIFFSMTALRSGVAEGDTVDVAFTPQINEFRGSRTVQLNLADIRPCQPVRDHDQLERDLYRRHRRGQLAYSEAAQLLPERREFVRLWRYLTANQSDGMLLEETGCLCRKISRSTGAPCSWIRTRICLDVFDEMGLISLQTRPKYLQITITATDQKVDLDTSTILQGLRRLQTGE